MHRSAVLKQILYHLQILLLDCKVKSTPSITLLMVDLCAVSEKPRNNPFLPFEGSLNERCSTLPIQNIYVLFWNEANSLVFRRILNCLPDLIGCVVMLSGRPGRAIHNHE